MTDRVLPIIPYAQGLAPAEVSASLCTPKHTKFMKLTAEKKRRAKHAIQKRLRGEDPFPVPEVKISGPVVPSMTRGAGTKVAFVVANQLEAGLTAGVSVQTGNQRCHTAELVVTDTLAPLLRSEVISTSRSHGKRS